MPSSEERQAIVREYNGIPQELRSALSGLDDSELDQRRAPDAWSIRQIVHHLVDSHDVTRGLILAAVGGSGCEYDLGWYDRTNRWAETMRYDERDIQCGLDLMRASHSRLTELLHAVPRGLERHVWLRRESQSAPVRLTVADIMQRQLAHARHHIGQIMATREKSGV